MSLKASYIELLAVQILKSGIAAVDPERTKQSLIRAFAGWRTNDSTDAAWSVGGFADFVQISTLSGQVMLVLVHPGWGFRL